MMVLAEPTVGKVRAQPEGIDTMNTTTDRRGIADDPTSLEVAWVSREALALMREGVGQDDPRRVVFLARKRAVLAYLEVPDGARS